MKSEPVLVVMSVLAALQVAVGSAALTEVMPAKWAAFAVLVVAAAQAGIQFYVRGKVTPVTDD